MQTVTEIRRANLAALVAALGRGGQSQMARRLDKDKNQVSQWLSLPTKPQARNISDEIAREIEVTLGLERGWLDHPHRKDESFTPSPVVSQPAGLDADTLIEAARWADVEEGLGDRLTPENRLRRIAVIYRQLMLDGGRFTPEHSAAFIKDAQSRNANGGSRGRTKKEAAG